jgi:DNA-binding NtrC family response regulator
MNFGRDLTMVKKICVVDHDLSSRGYLRECLEREGYYVMTLENGFQIKTNFSDREVSVFILNIDSPGVRDKDLLKEIKGTYHARVLLIVSERGDAFLKEAIDLGVYGFLYKPFNQKEICTMVTHLVR